MRAEIAVTLKILKEADPGPGSSGRALWDAHLCQLQALAATLPQETLADLGLTGEIALVSADVAPSEA